MNALTPLLLSIATLVADEAAPCVSQPELGSLIDATATSSVLRAGGGLFQYRWRLTNARTSKRSIRSISIVDVTTGVETPEGWRSLTSSGSGRPVNVVTAAADDDRFDVKPGGELTFESRSDRYPSVTIARIYPRREMPCLPTTETEEKALEAAGWTGEKLRQLNLVDFWTHRAVVLAPLITRSARASKEALFLAAITHLRALREYLSLVPTTYTPAAVPIASSSLPETRDSLATLRSDALVRLPSSEDRAIIELLYSFYSTPHDAGGR